MKIDPINDSRYTPRRRYLIIRAAKTGNIRQDRRDLSQLLTSRRKKDGTNRLEENNIVKSAEEMCSQRVYL